MPRDFLDSTDTAADGPELRHRLDRSGYVFLRGVLPRDEILALRRRLLEMAQRGGWLDETAPLEAGIANMAGACKDPEPRYLDTFRPMWKLEALHRMKHHPNLVAVFERLLGGTVLVHPMFVLRNIFPQTEQFDFTTGSHQDRIHIGGGPSYACWIPIGDCPREMGSLIIAEASHKRGVLDIDLAPGAGGIEVAEKFADHWVGSDFAAGDVLIFTDTTVHKALPNRSRALRQSFDARYQLLSDPVADISVQPYAGLFTWNEVYANWRENDLKYYWERQGAKVVPFDRQYYDKRDALAFARAAAGDLLARDALLRILQRDPDMAKRERAARLLEGLDKRPKIESTPAE